MIEKVFRPRLDDVERISYGKAARRRGTGSSLVCHRLNQNERKLFDLAKQAGYLTVRGTGYRRRRKGSPLENIFRQRCDALEEICCIIEKKADCDTVLIDFSTLRVKNDQALMKDIVENVLNANYSELQPDIQCGSKGSDGSDERDILSKINSMSPVDWEAVKKNAIWGVDYRLITVDCDRETAKTIVADVMNRSKSFDLSMYQQRDRTEISDEDNNTDTVPSEEEEDPIDWDDI